MHLDRIGNRYDSITVCGLVTENFAESCWVSIQHQQVTSFFENFQCFDGDCPEKKKIKRPGPFWRKWNFGNKLSVVCFYVKDNVSWQRWITDSILCKFGAAGVQPQTAQLFLLHRYSLRNQCHQCSTITGTGCARVHFIEGLGGGGGGLAISTCWYGVSKCFKAVVQWLTVKLRTRHFSFSNGCAQRWSALFVRLFLTLA